MDCTTSLRVSILGSGGLHLSVHFRPSLSAESITQSAWESNLPITPIGPYCAEDLPDNDFLIHFAHISAEAATARVKAFEKGL